jgi:hypothetical protein
MSFGAAEGTTHFIYFLACGGCSYCCENAADMRSSMLLLLLLLPT